MKKKLKFCIALLLVFAVSVSVFITPASSFQTDVVTSSDAMLLINLDTRTIVFSQKADKIWNASYLSELMTFLLLTENVENPQEIQLEVNEDFIDELDDSDDCLKPYLGEKLTLKDLAAIMLLTSGSDAAFMIADYLGKGEVDDFVTMMNNRATTLGCKQTVFVSPGYSESKEQYTTCLDLSRIYNRLLNNTLYQEIMENETYIPEQFGDDTSYAVMTENSMMNPQSPYYFRYTTGGKFAYDPVAGASLAVTTTYRNMSYLFIALRGKNEAEENVYTDARHLTTWAYLNLSDHKVVDTGEPVAKSTVVTGWGEYPILLYADNSAYKTLPNEYDPEKFTVQTKVADKLELPLFKGEAVGTAQITYAGERLDNVRIVPDHDEGVSLLSDFGRFGGYALAKLFPNVPEAAQPENTTETTKETKPANTAAMEE